MNPTLVFRAAIVMASFSALTLTASLASAQSAPASAAGTDHAQAVGHIGVGWYGVSSIPLGTAGANSTTVTNTPVVAPAIGVRYWVNDTFGIDGAIGFNLTSGSNTTTNGGTDTSVNTPSAVGFLLHVGVPLVLGNVGPHFVVELTPEANLGIASGTTKVPGAADISNSGFLLSLGARIGAEIQFGFMGLPNLALEGSIGLFLQDTSYGASTTSKTGAKEGDSVSALTIATSSFNQPWDFLRSTVAARYYF